MISEQNSYIFTDDFRLNTLPPNCTVQTKTVAKEVAKMLYNSCAKNQVKMRFKESEGLFQKEIGADYTEELYPRKFMKGDTIINVSYYKARVEEDTELSGGILETKIVKEARKEFLIYRLITIT